jgi:hypothetical protein
LLFFEEGRDVYAEASDVRKDHSLLVLATTENTQNTKDAPSAQDCFLTQKAQGSQGVVKTRDCAEKARKMNVLSDFSAYLCRFWLFCADFWGFCGFGAQGAKKIRVESVFCSRPR